MRLSVVARSVLLLLVSASPALLRAQFDPPSVDELKMTADPKAPGAAAVYLFREESTDDIGHTQTYYVRIKVLAEKGKELATVRLPYDSDRFKVTDIVGRTIHADGTIYSLTVKPTDLMEIKTKDFQINETVFNLPNVDVGSVLEYRMKLHYVGMDYYSPTWEIQQPYFVRKAHFSFRTDRNQMYTMKIDSDAKVIKGNNGVYALDLTDIPPLPKEDWMPPLDSFRWRVEFGFSLAGNGVRFWNSEGKWWADGTIEFANTTSTLKLAVTDIVDPGDSERVKAEKIYAAVMKIENTSFTRAKSKAERKKEKLKDTDSAEIVWKQQRGSSNQIALLYVALARAAKLKAWPMQVVNRDRALFNSGHLSMDQLDDYIVVVMIDGKEELLDPGQKMCPFGYLHWKHTLATGIRLTDKGTEFDTTPGAAFKKSTEQRIADLSVDETGGISGTVRIVMTGAKALYWRQLTLENDEDEVKKRFNESLRDDLPEGVQADFHHFLALQDYQNNLIAIVNISGNIGSATGKRFFLPGLFFEARAQHPFVAEDKRITPIDVHYPRMEQEDVTYHLPAGYNVESLPQTAHVLWADHALLKISAGEKDGSVTVQRSMLYNFTQLDAKEYDKIHDFFQKVATADQQQLVLVRAAAAKGK